MGAFSFPDVASEYGVSRWSQRWDGVILSAMVVRSGAMHVARVVGRYRANSGEQREYVSHLLRRTFRQDGKVKHETLANLSPLPGPAIEAVRACLAGKTLLVAGEDVEVRFPHFVGGLVTWFLP